MKKILIVGASHLCRNPRLVKEASALGAAGYDVTVLSLSTHERFKFVDRALVSSLPFRWLTLDCDEPNPLARAKNFFRRSVTWAARQSLRWLGKESVSALGPAHALLGRILAHPADLTILHGEMPLWAARKLIRRGRAIAVDFEDWYSEDLLAEDRRARPLRLLRQAERFALHSARYTSCPSQSMADALTGECGGATPIVLRNVFPLQLSTRLGRAQDDIPAFVWFSQTVGPGRGLEPFFSVWKLTTVPSRIFIIGDERRAYRETLLERIEQQRRGLVHFLPFIEPQSLPGKLTEYDIGLALEPRQPRNKDLTISNKIFQYFNAGLAVVATETFGQREALQAAPDCGLLLDLNDAELAATRLDALLSDRTRLRSMQAAARHAAEENFCWEKEAPKLLDAVQKAVSARSGPQ